MKNFRQRLIKIQGKISRGTVKFASMFHFLQNLIISNKNAFFPPGKKWLGILKKYLGIK